MDNPIILTLGALGIVINLLFSGGTLFKLIEFAKDYGQLKQTVHTNDMEVSRARDNIHELRNQIQAVALQGAAAAALSKSVTKEE